MQASYNFLTYEPQNESFYCLTQTCNVILTERSIFGLRPIFSEALSFLQMTNTKTLTPKIKFTNRR